MYTYEDASRLAYALARKKGVPTRYIGNHVAALVDRKRNRPVSALDAARAAVERAATAERRLAHDTGAENWY